MAGDSSGPFINYPMAGDSSGALLIIRWLEIPPGLYYLSDGWRFFQRFIYPMAGDSSGALLIIRWLEIPPAPLLIIRWLDIPPALY